MSNVLQRLLLFFGAIPLAAALIVFLPQLNHGAAVLAILVFVGGCSVEISRFFKSRDFAANQALFAALGLSAPLGAYLGGLLLPWLTVYGAFLGLSLALALALTLAFVSFPFVRSGAIPEVLPDASTRSLVAVYPGLFGAFIVLIATEPRYATQSLLTYCILVLGNDSLAWLVGMTMGKKRNIVAVSPNKSLAGFVGGASATAGLAVAAKAVFPNEMRGPWWAALAMGLVIGAAVILGDLFESALKRSAGIKDSGTAVPGRGGFLDTFDSLLFAAPVFYGLSLLLGYFR